VGFARTESFAATDASLAVQLEEPVLQVDDDSPRVQSGQVANLYRALATYAEVDLVLLVGRVDGVAMLQLYSLEHDAFTPAVTLTEVGDLAELVEGTGRLAARTRSKGPNISAANAARAKPVSIGGNLWLSRYLLAPDASIAPRLPKGAMAGGPGAPDGKKKLSKGAVIGIAVGSVVAVAAIVVAAVLAGGGEPAPATGTITVSPAR